jgi:mono/diheme cytochrome c family protein
MSVKQSQTLHWLLPIAMLIASLTVYGWASAQVPALYEGADLALGEKLIADNKCTACHQRRVGGDGSAMYRPGERVTTLGALRGMVEACNMQLNLGLFPEEVTSIAAVLNRDHYRLK